jgi:hypothetical protein
VRSVFPFHFAVLHPALDAFAHAATHADWTYMALPTTEMFRMPFAEQLDLMRKALGAIHRRIPQVESILRRSGHMDTNSLVRSSVYPLHLS